MELSQESQFYQKALIAALLKELNPLFLPSTDIIASVLVSHPWPDAVEDKIGKIMLLLHYSPELGMKVVPLIYKILSEQGSTM
jgi:hypothetical protein